MPHGSLGVSTGAKGPTCTQSPGWGPQPWCQARGTWVGGQAALGEHDLPKTPQPWAGDAGSRHVLLRVPSPAPGRGPAPGCSSRSTSPVPPPSPPCPLKAGFRACHVPLSGKPQRTRCVGELKEGKGPDTPSRPPAPESTPAPARPRQPAATTPATGTGLGSRTRTHTCPQAGAGRGVRGARGVRGVRGVRAAPRAPAPPGGA